MSTEEKLFFFSWLANYKKQSVYLFRGIDRDLDYESQNMIYYILLKIHDTFKDAYVVTHKINLLGEPGCDSYTVDSDLQLKPIEYEDALEHVI